MGSHAGEQLPDTLQRMPSGHTNVAHGSPVHLWGVRVFLANGPQLASVAIRTATTVTPNGPERVMRATVAPRRRACQCPAS